MASSVLNASQELRMTDTSFESSSLSLQAGTDINTTVSDDEDDELLALRIAALESIKLQKSKPPAAKSTSLSPETEKPDFVIKSHPGRSNLLSIVTCEDDQEAAAPALPGSTPPAPLPYFDPTRPPPGFGQNRFSRSPFSRRSRSPLYRRFVSRSRSRSPGRRPWSRSPPPQYRRRSISPYRRRRSFSRSPTRRSPPRRRSQSPSGRRKPPSPPPSPAVSEWETDTESEEEPESDKKEEEEKSEDKQENKENQEKSNPEPVSDAKKPLSKTISQEDDAEDILKLDASAEEDEFSAFLNEFEDEVLSKKEPPKVAKEKKERPPTEKKVVDGKRLRKKIKPKKATPPPAETKNNSPRRQRSPGRRYFSPNKSRDGKFSPRRKEERISQDRPRKSRERNAKSREKTLKDSKPGDSAVDREDREKKEFEDRMAKLTTPEREMMEARRKKFEKKIDVSKKISLKSEKTEEPDMRLDIRRRIGGHKDNDKQPKAEADSPPRKRVTDLRVQLHKKRKAHDGEAEKKKAQQVSEVSVSPERNHPAEPEEEDFGPVARSGRRRVVAPGVRLQAKLNHSEDESDRSPSPLPKLRTRKTSGANINLQDSSLKGRRILVVRKERNSSPEQDKITQDAQSQRKGIKKSLHLRLGGKVDGYSESEIYMEMVKEDKKLSKKLKKEKKALKKEKKAKKSKKQKAKESDSERSGDEPLDSDEELYRFFEEPPAPPPAAPKESKKSSKRRSGDRNSSGEKPSGRIVRAKGHSDLNSEELDIGKRLKSKRRSSNEGSLDGESADLLERMRRKNEKRLKRMREIEQDKLMFA